MTTENALPVAEESVEAGADEAKVIADAAPENVESAEGANDEVKAKPEKTPEQREIDRLRRGIDRKTRQLAEARARADLTPRQNEAHNANTEDDSKPLSLTRAELAELVKAEAAKLAPALHQEKAEVERRQGVVQRLEKAWGQEKFDELASDIDDAFGGLIDSSGKPKPATEAIFEADDPVKVIEWLSDPENLDEAERISRMSAVQAGKAIAKLESKLETDSKGKPKPSKASAPLEAVRGAGPASKPLAALSGDDFARARREQIAKR